MGEHPILVLIRGIPGSGKSYFAKALREAIGIDRSIMLDPDATNYDSDEYKAHVDQQNAEGVDPKLHPYRFLRAQAYDAITEHKIVLWNQPFTNLEIMQKVTDRLQEHAGENNTTLPILVIEVDIDPAIAKERVAQRKKEGGHGPTDETFARFTNEYATSATVGYKVITVDGSAALSTTIPIALEAIQSLA